MEGKKGKEEKSNFKKHRVNSCLKIINYKKSHEQNIILSLDGSESKEEKYIFCPSQ